MENGHTYPNLAWLNDKLLFSEDLSYRLNNIYKHRNSGPNYYIKLSSISVPTFGKEEPYKAVSSEDDGFRMLALFRFWSIIEYFFPYKYLLKENWSEVLKEFVPAFASSRSPLNYRLACLRLINRVHDTHARIYMDPILEEHFGKKGPNINFKILENKVIVFDYFNDSLAADETLSPGDEITTVNGKKISDLRRIATPYLCASNEPSANRNFIEKFLFRSNDDSLLVMYKRGNKPNPHCSF